MNKIVTEELRKEHGIPCISIIVPTHRLATYREADAEKVNKAIADAKAKLAKEYAASALLDKIVSSLDNLAGQIDYTHSLDGIGIYVSEHYNKLVQFPFPVNEKNIVADSFDSRDLLYMEQNIMDYHVLSLSKKYLRLFECSGEEINEIKNDDFPMEYQEEFEYAHPSAANSFMSNVLVGYEKDKSVLQEERLKEFMRVADSKLGKYIKGDMPLIISGDNKELVDFMNITGYQKNVIGKVKGNYVVKKDLASQAWLQVQNYIKNRNEVVASDITEMIGKHKAVAGIEDVWKAAQEGKGLKLIIEKDFQQDGYISADGSKLAQKKLKNEQNEYAPMVADMLIKNIMSKKGSVLFAENGSLEKFNGVALVLRYS